MIDKMTSSRPYLVRALHAWISDNDLTPYVVVDVNYPQISVPSGYAEEGKIVLNCSYNAVVRLSLENDWISFTARFGGAPQRISFPPEAVMAIYAKENGQGMVFQEEAVAAPSPAEPPTTAAPETTGGGDDSHATPSRGRKPTLKLV